MPGLLERLRPPQTDPMADVTAEQIAYLRAQNLKFQTWMRVKVEDMEQRVAAKQQRLSGVGLEMADEEEAEELAAPAVEPEEEEVAPSIPPLNLAAGNTLAADDAPPPRPAAPQTTPRPPAPPPPAVADWQAMLLGSGGALPDAAAEPEHEAEASYAAPDDDEPAFFQEDEAGDGDAAPDDDEPVFFQEDEAGDGDEPAFFTASADEAPAEEISLAAPPAPPSDDGDLLGVNWWSTPAVSSPPPAATRPVAITLPPPAATRPVAITLPPPAATRPVTTLPPVDLSAADEPPAAAEEAAAEEDDEAPELARLNDLGAGPEGNWS